MINRKQQAATHRIGIGIDTGGTYTDAVLYDFGAKRILAKAKALTTRHDLTVGILEAFDKLDPAAFPPPRILALSTTLATNACVENRMGRAKLIFFGGDAALIDACGPEYGLPPSSEIIIQSCSANYSRGGLGDVDWDGFQRDLARRLDGLDGVGIIETYSMRNGAVIENRAKEIVAATAAIPTVCGHELVSELSCLRRGAGTLLNACLFPTIHDFIAAIKRAMERRGVDVPVMIVRSDGNLMSEGFAALRPVETLLSGPAASVMGCLELTGEQDCVVVDMGGTTTDIAVVRDGAPLRSANGVGVGNWRIFIKGLYINTFGLGGDSAVRFRENRLVLEDHRVVPLCIVGARFPGVVPRLRRLLDDVGRHTRCLHEFLVLVKDIAGSDRYDDREKAVCAGLKAGPLILREAAALVGQDEYSFDAGRLIRDGVVQVCGLTPTDIMHIRGDYGAYDAEASTLGARFVANGLETTVEALCDGVYAEVTRKLYVGIVKALMENDNPAYRAKGFPESVEALIHESFTRLHAGGRTLARFDVKTDLALVGIGAPIHVFLPKVAAMLGARAVVPEHSAVANALGAVVGRIHAESEWNVRPMYNPGGIYGYSVYGSGAVETFDEMEDAVLFAAEAARGEARDEVRRRGATGEIAVHIESQSQSGESMEGMLYLGTRVVAHATGSSSL